MASRAVRARWASRRWKVPTATSTSKPTAVAAMARGATGTGNVAGDRWRRGSRIRASVITAAATSRAKAVGAWVVGNPEPENSV